MSNHQSGKKVKYKEKLARKKPEIFLPVSKRRESDEEYEDEFIDDAEQDSNGASSDETATNNLSTDDDDDLAMGGQSTGWLSKSKPKVSQSQKIKVFLLKSQKITTKPKVSSNQNLIFI